jgi:hypothetical protein
LTDVQIICYTVYFTGLVVTALFTLAGEIETYGDPNKLDAVDLMLMVLFHLIWPVYVMLIVYDSVEARRAQTRNHDPDKY